MKKAWKWIKLVLACIPRVAFEYFTYMRKMAKHPEKYPLEERYAKVRSTVRFILRHMHINPLKDCYDVELETRGKLYVGNHLSFLDPLFLIALSPEPIGFVAKEEAMKIPFAGKMIKIINGIFIDRKDPISTLRAFRNLSKVIKEANMGYAVFPEGTRNHFPYGMMNEFHPGAFKLAQMAELNIVPIALFGEQRILEEKPIYRNYPTQLTVLPEIPFEEVGKMGTSDFAVHIYHLIDVPLQEMIRTDMAYMTDKAYKNKAPKWWKKKKEQPEEGENNEAAR